MGELRIPGITRSLMLRTHASDEWISPSIERCGIWEPYETEVILRNLREGDVFVDIGANIGYYTVIAASAVGAEGKIFAFEPDPTNYDLLEHNIAANGFTNVWASPKAVSSSSEERYLYLCEKNKGDHRLYDSRDSRARIAVPCVDLDSFVEAIGIRVDFVKSDAQGSEAEILRGMRKLLRREAGHLKLILEFWPYGLWKSGSSPEELISLLPAEQFDILAIDEEARALRPMTQDEILRECQEVRYTNDERYLNLFLTPRQTSARPGLAI